MKCESCGHVTPDATKVSIHYMYDAFVFDKAKGCTVDEIITNWLEHNKRKHPALLGGHEVDDLGPAYLCPAIVLDKDGMELRRVGKMLIPHWKTKEVNQKDLIAYRDALLSDPDIQRLLKAREVSE